MTDDDDQDEDELRAEALLADLERLAGQPCGRCAGSMCGHEHVLSVVMGFKGTLVCLTCLAGALGRAREELRDDALEHIRRRDCFRQGWEASSLREGLGASLHPACLWAQERAGDSVTTAAAAPTSPASAPPPHTAEWDADDMSCGDLVLALRLRLQDLSAAAVIRVRATDLAAPIDLPAWCRMTRHTLVHMNHPIYWIEKRREDPHGR